MFIQARKISEEERGEADGEEAPDSDKTAKKEEDTVENEVEEKVEEVKLDGEGKKTATEEDLVVSKIADLAVQSSRAQGCTLMSLSHLCIFPETKPGAA